MGFVAQALLTAVALGMAGLVVTTVFGLRAVTTADIWRHISFGIFSTFVTLLAHSMMMFYLIGKGKAVKDAMIEGGRGAAQDPNYSKYVGRISAARRPNRSLLQVARLRSQKIGVWPARCESMSRGLMAMIFRPWKDFSGSNRSRRGHRRSRSIWPRCAPSSPRSPNRHASSRK